VPDEERGDSPAPAWPRVQSRSYLGLSEAHPRVAALAGTHERTSSRCGVEMTYLADGFAHSMLINEERLAYSLHSALVSCEEDP
jgi:hypothetical protein